MYDNAIASLCLCIHLSIRPFFHSIFGTDWPLTLNFCTWLSHDHSSHGIGGHKSGSRSWARLMQSVQPWSRTVFIVVLRSEFCTVKYHLTSLFRCALYVSVFLYRPTWVVLDKRPLSGCCCLCCCYLIYSVVQNILFPEVFWQFFPNGRELLEEYSPTYCPSTSAVNYEILFSYL